MCGCTGPELLLQHSIQPEHLQQVAALVEPAVEDCLQRHLLCLAPPTDYQQHQQQQQQSDTTTTGQNSRSADPAAICALLGCLGRCLQLHSKAKPGSRSQQATSAGKATALQQKLLAQAGATGLQPHAQPGESESDEQEDHHEDDAMSENSADSDTGNGGTDNGSSNINNASSSSTDSDAIMEEPQEQAEANIPQAHKQEQAHIGQQQPQHAQHGFESHAPSAAVGHAVDNTQLERLIEDMRAMLSKPCQFQTGSGPSMPSR